MQRTLLLLGLLALAAEARADEHDYHHHHEQRPVVLGSRAPAFGPVAVFNAKESGLSQLAFDGSKGKVWLISFFATWCPGCRNEMPLVKSLHETYGPKGLQVVTVSADTGRGSEMNLRAFLAGSDVHHPVIHDVNAEIVEAFEGHSLSLPAIYVVGPDGVVALFLEGFEDTTEAALRGTLDRLLK